MFNWFKKKNNTVEITRKAKDRLLIYLDHGDHTKLIDVFRDSIIENIDGTQYLMTEIHVGSVIEKLKQKLNHMDIIIYDTSFVQPTSLNTIFIEAKYVLNESLVMFTMIKLLMVHLGYEDCSHMHLAYKLARFISESSKV